MQVHCQSNFRPTQGSIVAANRWFNRIRRVSHRDRATRPRVVVKICYLLHNSKMIEWYVIVQMVRDLESYSRSSKMERFHITACQSSVVPTSIYIVACSSQSVCSSLHANRKRRLIIGQRPLKNFLKVIMSCQARSSLH